MTDIPPPSDKVKNQLAFALVGAFVVLIPLFVFKGIPAANKDIIVYMVGQLSGMALLALGYYFVNKAGQDALDAKRAENTSKVLDLANGVTGGDAGKGAQEVASAAQNKADQVKGK